MKGLFLVVSFSIFAVLFGSIPSTSYAQEEVIETETPVGVENTATISASPETDRINYELPFPGMLPDHPLYILKVMRDGVVKALINVPIKRARFSLLSGEKRVYAAKLLVEKGKDELAVETIGKSNNYLDEALHALDVVKRDTPKHMDIYPFLLQFRSAAIKHSEVVHDLKPSVDKQYLPQLEIEQKRIDAFIKTSDKLLKK